MNKIVKIADDVDQVALDKALELHKEIQARTMVTASNLLELGKLFKTIRDEKLYNLLGADTFNEYCGFPEISFGRSTIYSFIHVHEVFELKFSYPPKLLSKIGHRKLQIILPLFKREEDDIWIYQAQTLSESDLINEVRRAQGKPEMLPKPKEEENVYPFSFEDYLAFVKASPCITCGEKEVDNAHFPRSKGAGGRDTDCIPLCRQCHSNAHQDFYDWLWLNKDKIFRYFYDTIVKAYEIIRRER